MRLPRWLRRKHARVEGGSAYTDVRAKLDTLPPSLTEERVREIVREEMARSIPDLRIVVGQGGTVRVVRPGQTIRRTPGSAGTLKP